MERQRRFGALRLAGAVAAAVWLAAPMLEGQTGGAAAENEPLVGRFSAGARVSVVFNDLMNSEKLTSSTSEPPVKTTIGTVSRSSALAGSGMLEFAIFDNVSLVGEVLYRRAGYKFDLEIVEGVDDSATAEDDRRRTTKFEGTRANYWDIPLVARFYDGSRQEKRSRAFLDVGLAIRRVTNVRTFREFLNPDKTTAIDETPTAPVNATLPGLVFGGGFQILGPSGVKVVPEIRYTRWLGSTFESAPTRSKRNTVEFLFGIAF